MGIGEWRMENHSLFTIGYSLSRANAGSPPEQHVRRTVAADQK
jgi:hypothetical protein